MWRRGSRREVARLREFFRRTLDFGAFSDKESFASSARRKPLKGHFGGYYLLLQMAHILLQLLEKGSLLRALARQCGKRSAVALWGSLKNIAEFLVESLRNLVWPEEVFWPTNRIQIRLGSS